MTQSEFIALLRKDVEEYDKYFQDHPEHYETTPDNAQDWYADFITWFGT